MPSINDDLRNSREVLSEEVRRRKDIQQNRDKREEAIYSLSDKYNSDMNDIKRFTTNMIDDTFGAAVRHGDIGSKAEFLAGLIGVPSAALVSAVAGTGRSLGGVAELLGRGVVGGVQGAGEAISDLVNLRPFEPKDNDFFQQDSINYADVKNVDDVDQVNKVTIRDQNTGEPRDIQIGYKNGRIATIVDGDMDIFGRQNLVNYFKKYYNTDQGLEVGYGDLPEDMQWSVNSDDIFVPSESFDRLRTSRRSRMNLIN